MTARSFFHLPYYNTSISLDQEGDTITYSSKRGGAASPAEFNGRWTIGADMPQAEPGSLDFFLVERYCLYTSDEGKLYRCRIFHKPWPLQEAGLSAYRASLFEADGLPAPAGEPLLHSGGPVNVEVWPLEEV